MLPVLRVGFLVQAEAAVEEALEQADAARHPARAHPLPRLKAQQFLQLLFRQFLAHRPQHRAAVAAVVQAVKEAEAVAAQVVVEVAVAPVQAAVVSLR